MKKFILSITGIFLIAVISVYYTYRDIPELELPVKITNAITALDGGTTHITFLGSNGNQLNLGVIASQESSEFYTLYFIKVLSIDIPYYVPKGSRAEDNLVKELNRYTKSMDMHSQEITKSLIFSIHITDN